MRLTTPCALALVLVTACRGNETHVRSERPAAPARTARAGESAEKKTSAAPAATVDSTAWRGPSTVDWLSWRGPHQDGTSSETSTPVSIDPSQPFWSVPICGRGTPVVAGGLVYAIGYQGE